MIVVLLIDDVEVKEWWWPDVHFGCDEESHQKLERHITAATENCKSDVSKMVNESRCTWAVKIKSNSKRKK